MDVEMPEMDGITATQRIREIEQLSDLPIIAMMTHAMSDGRKQAKDAGMNAFINKPFKPRNLIDTVEDWGSRNERSTPQSEVDASEASGVDTSTPTMCPVDLEGFRDAMREAGVEVGIRYTTTLPERRPDLVRWCVRGDDHSVSSGEPARFRGSDQPVGGGRASCHRVAPRVKHHHRSPAGPTTY